jgi:hypothetical protein
MSAPSKRVVLTIADWNPRVVPGIPNPTLATLVVQDLQYRPFRRQPCFSDWYNIQCGNCQQSLRI